MCIFSKGEIIGWEEILRERVMNNLRDQQQKARKEKDFELLAQLEKLDLGSENKTHFCSFGAEVTSMTAKLYYLSRENFEANCRYISPEKCQVEVEKRMNLL